MFRRDEIAKGTNKMPWVERVPNDLLKQKPKTIEKWYNRDSTIKCFICALSIGTLIKVKDGIYTHKNCQVN